MYDKLKTLLPESLILTATSRLALRLQQALHQSEQVMPTYPIYALRDWYMLMFKHLQAAGLTQSAHVMSPFEEQVVWESILEGSPYASILLKPQETAKTLMQTWGLLKQWRLQLHDIQWGEQEEGKLFHQWALQFEQTINKHAWIPSASLASTLFANEFMRDALSSRIKQPKIVLVGFDDLTPELQWILKHLEGMGFQTQCFQNVQEPERIERFVFSHFEQEVRAVAFDAKQWVDNNPGIFAVIVPDLAMNRDALYNTFKEVLEPAQVLSPVEQVSAAYNLSAGIPLIKYPIVQAAFKVWRCVTGSLTLSDLESILASPFYHQGLTRELDYARLLFALKELELQSIPMTTLIEQAKVLDLSEWADFFSTMYALYLKGTQACSWYHIKEQLYGTLKQIGWPGQRPLNSVEHQTVARLYHVIDELISLHMIRPESTFQQGLVYLRRLCQEISFQPESAKVRIQIMGLLEASGQSFDKCWIVGLNSDIWPPLPKPNAFIPLSVQRQMNMPHASATRELAFARSVLDHLIHSSHHIVVSHYQEESARKCSPSPLIQHLPVEQYTMGFSEPLFQVLHKHQLVEARIYEDNVPLAENEQLRGGTTLIQYQSNCPFKAFATFRLHAKEPRAWSAGISMLDRGVLLHQILEQVWLKIKNHRTLCSMTQDARKVVVDEALESLQSHPRMINIKPFYWAIEKERMQQVVNAWLELESSRQPFEMHALEKWVEVKLEHLTIQCRVDRVDLTEEGDPVIIDYKSGKVKLSDCFGERPNAPQLPLYCFADFPSNPKGVVFAELSRKGCQFVGVSEHANVFPKVKAAVDLNQFSQTWQELLSQWKEILDHLSLQLKQGYVKVDPKEPWMCDRCDLHALCRISEVGHA